MLCINKMYINKPLSSCVIVISFNIISWTKVAHDAIKQLINSGFLVMA